MIVFLVVLVAVVLLLLRRRARRARLLAGLDGARPVFYVEPPTRRLGSRKGERL